MTKHAQTMYFCFLLRKKKIGLSLSYYKGNFCHCFDASKHRLLQFNWGCNYSVEYLLSPSSRCAWDLPIVRFGFPSHSFSLFQFTGGCNDSVEYLLPPRCRCAWGLKLRSVLHVVLFVIRCGRGLGGVAYLEKSEDEKHCSRFEWIVFICITRL